MSVATRSGKRHPNALGLCEHAIGLAAKMRARAARARRIFSLVASGPLHAIDPHRYVDPGLRVLPYWPQHRHLELAPTSWKATRVKLRADELEAPL